MPESLKNVILVMNASDLLVHPSPESSNANTNEPDEALMLWNETQDRLEQFLPGLIQELIPPPLPPNTSATTEPTNATTPPAATKAQS